MAYSRILSQAAPRPLPTFPSQPANSNGGGGKSPRRRPQRSASQEDSSEYRDPHGYGCRAWRDYDCTRYARSHEKFTEKQVEELNKNCPAACSHGTANEAEVVDNLTDRERAVVKARAPFLLSICCSVYFFLSLHADCWTAKAKTRAVGRRKGGGHGDGVGVGVAPLLFSVPHFCILYSCHHRMTLHTQGCWSGPASKCQVSYVGGWVRCIGRGTTDSSPSTSL